MKKFIIIILVLFVVASAEEVKAGDGGHLTIVNATPYDWQRTVYDSDDDNSSWKFPSFIRAGTSTNVYVEFDRVGHTTREVHYKILGVKDDDIHIYLKTKKYDETINVLYKLGSQNVTRDKRYDLGFEHDGYVSLIVVGDHDNYLCNSATWAKDWMHRMLPWIGDVPLNQLAITGSHDAGMGYVGQKTLLVADCAVRTQNHLIKKQLDYGARYFDIRPILRDGQYNTGHYGHDETLGWLGADGQSLSGIIKDINSFTDDHKELIILDITHDLNIDTGNSFSDDEWDALYDQLSGINHLCDKNGSDLKSSTLNDLIKGESQVIILVNKTFTLFNNPGKGFFSSSDFNIYGKYANTNDFKSMKHDQFQKMQDHSMNQYFLLSWTLTQSTWQQMNCDENIVGTMSITDLAHVANQNLPGSLFKETSMFKYPNIILTDLVVDNNSALMAMAINYRNMIDLQSVRVPPLTPDRTFYHQAGSFLFLNSFMFYNFMQIPYFKKELFYNYKQENLCFQVNDTEDKIHIYHGFQGLGLFSKLYNGLIDIDMYQNSDGKSYLSFCTTYKGHLTVGWHVEQKTLPHLGLATVAPTNFPYEQFTHTMYSDISSFDLRGAYEQIENSDTLLCFVYDTKIVRAKFGTDLSWHRLIDTKDFSTQEYLNLNPKIRQVMSYKQDGETRLLIVVQDYIPNSQGGFLDNHNFYLYQYLPKTNEMIKTFEFGNQRDVFMIEGAIDKIYNDPDNESNKFISNRFQAFVCGNKKVPHTNSYVSYIYTFGVKPDETKLLTNPLSTYFLDPPSKSYLIGEGEKYVLINASYSYVSNTNGGTDREIWLWYATNKKLLTAQIFKSADVDEGVMKDSFIKELTEKINWNVYPNPTTNANKFVVEYEITKPSNVYLELYSIQGILIKHMKVQQKQIGNFDFEINTSGLNQGIYTIVLRINDYAESKIVYID